MRLSVILAPFAIAIAAIAAPAQAQWNEALSCIETGYSSADQQVIDSFDDQFDIKDPSTGVALKQVLEARALICLSGIETADETDVAMLVSYRLSQIMLDVMTRQDPEVATIVQRIDQDLDPDKRERFYAIMSLITTGDPDTGGGYQPSQRELNFLGTTVLAAPVSARPDQAEAIGAYVATKIVLEQAASHFRN